MTRGNILIVADITGLEPPIIAPQYSPTYRDLSKSDSLSRPACARPRSAEWL